MRTRRASLLLVPALLGTGARALAAQDAARATARCDAELQARDLPVIERGELRPGDGGMLELPYVVRGQFGRATNLVCRYDAARDAAIIASPSGEVSERDRERGLGLPPAVEERCRAAAGRAGVVLERVVAWEPDGRRTRVRWSARSGRWVHELRCLTGGTDADTWLESDWLEGLRPDRGLAQEAATACSQEARRRRVALLEVAAVRLRRDELRVRYRLGQPWHDAVLECAYDVTRRRAALGDLPPVPGPVPGPGPGPAPVPGPAPLPPPAGGPGVGVLPGVDGPVSARHEARLACTREAGRQGLRVVEVREVPRGGRRVVALELRVARQDRAYTADCEYDASARRARFAVQ